MSLYIILQVSKPDICLNILEQVQSPPHSETYNLLNTDFRLILGIDRYPKPRYRFGIGTEKVRSVHP